jgi:magnesium transporter
MTAATIFLADSTVDTDDIDEIGRAIADPGALVWIDICGPEEGDLDPLVDVLGLHELAVEDVNKHGQRAKLERFPSHAFLVAYARAEDGDMSEVDFFVGANWLLTVRELNDHGESFSIDAARARYERTRQVDRKVGYLLYTLVDSLVDGYFSEADKVEDRLELIEEDLFEYGPPVDGSLQQELLTLRRELIVFRRRVVPLRDVVLSLLRREIPWIEEQAILYFEDVLDHLLRVTDQIDTQRELMGNVVDASLALSSNRMNEVMKKMTSWGAILIVATLVAGIYGMNFQNMPELRWKYGYFAALGTMLATTGTLYVYFKRKKWL